MTGKSIIFILPAVILAASCSIKNDIPYPIVEGSVLSFAVEGQCGANGDGSGQSSIDKTNRTVTLYVNDTVDVKKIRVTKFTVNDNAAIIPDASQCVNFEKFPSAGFESLDSIPVSSDTRMDFSRSATFTLRTYQDYEWTVTVSQVIQRNLLLENQIGKAVVDDVNKNVVIYVAKGQALDKIKVTSFGLGGIHGKVSPDPVESSVFDFSTPREFTVTYAWGGVSDRWTVYVYEKEGAVATTLEVFPMAVKALLSGEIQSGKTPVIEYKTSSATLWNTLPTSDVEVAGTTYSATLKGLSCATEYECRVSVDGAAGGTQSFTTAPATPLTDGDFDSWNQDGKLWNPWAADGTSFWDTGNRGATTISASNSVPTDDTCDGQGKAALLESKYLVIKFAAGNIFTGSYLKTVGTNGVLSFGREFNSFPSKLRVHYKYSSATIDKVGDDDYSYLKGLADSCHIYIALTDWDEPLEIRTKPSERQLFDKHGANVIAYAEFVSGESVSSYTQVDLPLNYRFSGRTPKYIVVVASASKYGDFFTGGTGSQLWVDNFELIYE